MRIAVLLCVSMICAQPARADHLDDQARQAVFNWRSSDFSDVSAVHPPLVALLYRALPARDPNRTLATANRLLLVVLFALLIALLGRARGFELLGLALLMACNHPLLRAEALNHISLVATVLLGGVWVTLERNHLRAAGALLALAVMVKPSLALMLPLLAWHAPAMVVACLGTSAALLAASLIYAGWSSHLSYLHQMLPSLRSPLAMVAGLLLYAAALWAVRRWRAAPVLWIYGFAWLVTTIGWPLTRDWDYAPALFLFAAWYVAWRERRLPPWLLAPLAVSLVLLSSHLEVAISYRLIGALVQLGALVVWIERPAEVRA